MNSHSVHWIPTQYLISLNSNSVPQFIEFQLSNSVYWVTTQFWIQAWNQAKIELIKNTRLKVAFGDRLALRVLVSSMVWTRFQNYSIMKMFDCENFRFFPIFDFPILNNCNRFYRPPDYVYKISSGSVEGGRSYEGGRTDTQTDTQTDKRLF